MSQISFFFGLFLFMNYYKIYNEICNRAKRELQDRLYNRLENKKYYEGHHIIPRCLGGEGKHGDYKHKNIALLTAKEHYIVHLLLCEIYPKSDKLKYALFAMINQTTGHVNRYTPSALTYERLREQFINVLKSTPKTEAHIKAAKEAVNRPEVKKAKSDKLKNVRKTEEHKKNLKKRWQNEETRQWIVNKMKESCKDPKVIENRRRASILGNEKMKNMPDVVCPHCGKIGKRPRIIQWHFDNCKYRNNGH